MIRPEKVDFSSAQVGDKVTCLKYGKGVIRKIVGVTKYKITVEFDEYVIDYRINGKEIDSTQSPTLYHGHFDGWPTEENLVRPEPPVTFEKDEKVVLVNCNEDKYKRYYSHFENGTHYVFIRGTNSWGDGTPMPWYGKIRKPTKEELGER